MRTTLDIDPDLLEELRERAFRTGRSFKEVVNAALRAGTREAGAGKPRTRRYRCPSVSLGQPAVNLDKALSTATDLEDEETVRDLELRK